MHCRCPACRRTTHVPAEQLDFLSRCQRCRALFIARTPQDPAQPQRLFTMQPPTDPATPLPRVHLADLLSPKEPIPEESYPEILAALAREIAAAPPPALRQKELRRFQLRWKRHALGVISVCGLLAIVFLILVVIILKARTFPQPASADTLLPPPSSNPQQNTTPPARVEIETRPTNSPESSGDLFPNVKPQR